MELALAGIPRDRFNRAASFYRQPAKKPSTFRRTLRNIFLAAVTVLSVLMPSGRLMHYRMPTRRDETAVTELVQPPQPTTINIQQQAEAPYVSQRAGEALSSRSLTAGEAQLARALFGNKINLNGIRLHTFAREVKGYRSDVMNGDTKNIEFYGRSNGSPDFSSDSASKFGSFMHEMTLIAQNQAGESWLHGDVTGYDYPLGSEWSFKDYGPQQQRSIVEDYALRFLHPSRQSRWLPHQYGDDRADTDPFLIRLVENQFPGAKEARIAFQNIERRALTPGELALIKGIFGSQINTDIISQNFHPQEYSDIAGTATSGRDANYWGPRYYSRDFSQEKSAEKFGTFIHENAHLWQFQTDWKFTPVKPDVYKYPLDTKWKFTDYTHEQQAAIVEDYALQFLHSSHQMRWAPEVYNRQELQSKLPILRELVENQFPGARTLRQQFDAAQKGAAARSPVAQAPAVRPAQGLAPAPG